MLELIYTSSSKGLDKGSQGYCTVACTESMPRLLKTNLESMSGYSWVFSPHDKNFNNNPVNYSYMKVKVGQEWLTVFSRIGLSGLDYSGRPNKIAHYICLEDQDLAAYNEHSPSSIISDDNTFVESWEGSSHYLQQDSRRLSVQAHEHSTAYWQEVTGAGGWAAYLVEAYRDAPDTNINIIYDSPVEPLKLMAETTSLLTSKEQWDITFSTYFNGSSLNSNCKWRFILRGSKYFDELTSTKNVIDLNDLPGHPPDIELAGSKRSNEETSPIILWPSSSNEVPWEVESHTSVVVKPSSKESNKKKLITLILAMVIVAATIILINSSSTGNSAPEDQELVDIYNYRIKQELIPKDTELEEFGDVLISINIEDFLKKLKLHKKMAIDIFAIKPEKIQTDLMATNDYQVSDNVVNRLYIKKINGEFIQSKKALFKVNLSKKLIFEALSEVDSELIKDFKKNVFMMKVNRIILKFI